MDWLDLSSIQGKLKEASKFVDNFSLDNLQDEDLKNQRLREQKINEDRVQEQRKLKGSSESNGQPSSWLGVTSVFQETIKNASKFVEELKLDGAIDPHEKLFSGQENLSNIPSLQIDDLNDSKNIEHSNGSLESLSLPSTSLQTDLSNSISNLLSTVTQKSSLAPLDRIIIPKTNSNPRESQSLSKQIVSKLYQKDGVKVEITEATEVEKDQLILSTSSIQNDDNVYTTTNNYNNNIQATPYSYRSGITSTDNDVSDNSSNSKLTGSDDTTPATTTSTIFKTKLKFSSSSNNPLPTRKDQVHNQSNTVKIRQQQQPVIFSEDTSSTSTSPGLAAEGVNSDTVIIVKNLGSTYSSTIGRVSHSTASHGNSSEEIIAPATTTTTAYTITAATESDKQSYQRGNTIPSLAEISMSEEGVNRGKDSHAIFIDAAPTEPSSHPSKHDIQSLPGEGGTSGEGPEVAISAGNTVETARLGGHRKYPSVEDGDGGSGGSSAVNINQGLNDHRNNNRDTTIGNNNSNININQSNGVGAGAGILTGGSSSGSNSMNFESFTKSVSQHISQTTTNTASTLLSSIITAATSNTLGANIMAMKSSTTTTMTMSGKDEEEPSVFDLIEDHSNEDDDPILKRINYNRSHPPPPSPGSPSQYQLSTVPPTPPNLRGAGLSSGVSYADTYSDAHTSGFSQSAGGMGSTSTSISTPYLTRRNNPNSAYSPTIDDHTEEETDRRLHSGFSGFLSVQTWLLSRIRALQDLTASQTLILLWEYVSSGTGIATFSILLLVYSYYKFRRRLSFSDESE